MPTAGISLVREHTEQLRPPRALWVPFELGRPFGAPGDPAFQHSVLGALLALFDREDGPVILNDFPDDPPDTGAEKDGEAWVCPVRFPIPESGEDATLTALFEEIRRLAPWHAVAVENNGRTTTGATGMTIEDAARFLHTLREHASAGNGDDAIGGIAPPVASMTPGEAFLHASHDLRSWFTEAAGAQPGAASSQALGDWFWGETAAGALLLSLYPACRDSSDREIRQVARGFLVPRSQQHRLDSL